MLTQNFYFYYLDCCKVDAKLYVFQLCRCPFWWMIEFLPWALFDVLDCSSGLPCLVGSKYCVGEFSLSSFCISCPFSFSAYILQWKPIFIIFNILQWKPIYYIWVWTTGNPYSNFLWSTNYIRPARGGRGAEFGTLAPALSCLGESCQMPGGRIGPRTICPPVGIRPKTFF